MKKRLQRTLSGKSLFWRYFVLLLVVVCLFLVTLTFVDRQSARALQESYLEQAEASFRSNAAAFSDTLIRVNDLPTTVETSKYFITADVAQLPLKPQDSFALHQVGETFKKQCVLLGMNAECFLYYHKAQVCTTRNNRYFNQPEECFSSYLKYEGDIDVLGTMKRIMQGRSQISTLTLLPSVPVTIEGEGTGEYLTLLLRPAKRTQMYGFLLPAKDVLEYFHIEALPENSYLEIIHTDGTVMFSHNGELARNTGYSRLETQLPGLSVSVFLGIPQSYFTDAIRNTQRTAHLIFAVAVLVGLGLCFAFSHISVMPFRRLVRDHTNGQNVEAPTNELAAIDQVIKRSQQRGDELRRMLLSSVLVRMFSGLPVRDEECVRLSADEPLFQQPLQAAIVRDRVAQDRGEEEEALIDLLRERLDDPFLCEYINLQESVALFRAESSDYDRLQSVLRELNRPYGEQPRFVCGVSAPFMGMSEISTAIRQAQFCIPEEGSRSIGLFMEEGGTGTSPIAAPAFDLRQFQQALACWNRGEMHRLIDQMAHAASRGTGPRPEGVFYSILFLLQDAACAGQVPPDQYDSFDYEHTESPAANLRRLKELVSQLCERKQQQMSGRQQLCDNIVSYIRENYSDTGLCLFSLARHFEMSERFVRNAILSASGTNFSKLLTRVRMQEAARLLRNTSEEIGSVAALCGYPSISTFYRNFKKYYGITPAEYKLADDQHVPDPETEPGM